MSSGDQDMNLQKPLFKNEWNWSTVSIFVGFVLLIAGSGAAWQKAMSDQQATAYEVGSLRQALESEKAAIVSRLKDVELENKQLGNLSYRLTAVEQFGSNVAASVKEVQVSVNDIGSEMRVMREILQRMDPNPRIGNGRQ